MTIYTNTLNAWVADNQDKHAFKHLLALFGESKEQELNTPLPNNIVNSVDRLFCKVSTSVTDRVRQSLVAFKSSLLLLKDPRWTDQQLAQITGSLVLRPNWDKEEIIDFPAVIDFLNSVCILIDEIPEDLVDTYEGQSVIAININAAELEHVCGFKQLPTEI